MQAFLTILILLFCFYFFLICSENDYEGKVVKGTRNALFLVEHGKKRMFPDFYTYTRMGFTIDQVQKLPDNILESIPMGNTLTAIPVFRPEDRMYHSQCEDPDRMVNDLGVVPNLGNLARFANVYSRVRKSGKLDLLALGGSITAGGYFMEFVKHLQKQSNLSVSLHNHGHGATEITYTIFCVDIDRYQPDLVLIDFAVNDYGHPKLMDSLLRKVLLLPSKPIVVLVNLWVHRDCPVPRYLLHSYYYQIPLINVCPAVNLCYGKGQLPKHISDQYSKTDGVHPWGSHGVRFLGDLLYAWWKKLETLLVQDVSMDFDGKLNTHSHSFDQFLTKSSFSSGNQNTTMEDLYKELPAPIYISNPIGVCTRCEALADDADGKLAPITPPKGFRVVTRTKIGYGGFNPNDRNPTTVATKSFKRSWQANEPGSEISFRFYGTTVKIAIWQRRDGMGVLQAYVDGDKSRVAKASGFFKGYTWAMERNNTGRSEIIPLFEGLKDGFHTLTLVVSNEPANKWVPGHMTQVFALLSASDSLDCKSRT